MRVCDLGPLVVEDEGGQQPVVGTKGSAMLALLAIHVNEQVSVDALTEAAWGGRPGAGAASTLLSHIWRLRQLLEPGRRRGEAPRVLLNDAGGYRLVGSPATVDSLFFAEAAAQVRDQLAAGRPAEALDGADAALARWRGRPYGPAADAEWARPAVARLEELRATLQERRIAALLGLGALDTALSDLRPLLAALPFHEALRGLQMEALHRSGRTEEALQAYAAARRDLVEGVGIEPGRDLQELHRRILDDDPALSGPRTVTAREGLHLPPTLTPLLGRDTELHRLSGLVAEHSLVTISGPAGAGKTRLAVEVARAVALPDGVWFVDLVGVDDPSLLVDVVISTIGFVPSADATSLEDLAAYLGSRRVLLVLDNCEHLLAAVAELVETVLGSGESCRIVATSRERLGVAGEIGWTLEPLPLGDGLDSAAVRLLVDRLRAADPTLVLDDDGLAAAVRICRALDGLPLPLELAAARAPMFSLAEIADQVSTDPGRLRRPGRAARDHRATLRSTLDWSYRLLGGPEQAAHQQLSVLPGPFTEAAAEAVLGAGEPLVELVHRSMLVRVGSRPGRPTTFRQLVTVRDHARHALRENGSLAAVEDRRDDYTAALVARRPPLGTATEPEWYAALDDDEAAVRATLTRLLIERPGPAGARLTPRLTFYWYHRGRLAEATRWLTLAHDVLGAEDRAVVGLATAASLTLQGRHEQARPFVDATLPAAPRDDLLEVLIGLAGAAYIAGNPALVVELHPHLRRVATDAENLRLLVDAVGTLVLAAQGRLEDAAAEAAGVYERATRLGVPMAIWMSAGAPMALGLVGGRPELGVLWAERCMSAHFAFGTGAAGAFIETRANLATLQGDAPLAARLYGAAHSTTRRVGMHWPFRALTHDLLARTRGGLGEAGFDRLWQAGRLLTPSQVLDGLHAGFSD
jgi:predicted ATPase/DNA-binding SARP family transcriptional activator